MYNLHYQYLKLIHCKKSSFDTIVYVGFVETILPLPESLKTSDESVSVITTDSLVLFFHQTLIEKF